MCSPLFYPARRGFTLLELIIVVVVLATITAMALPRFSRTFSSVQLRNTALTLASRLRYAQARAMYERLAVQVRVDQRAGTYALYVEQAAAPGTFVRLADRYGRTFVLPREVAIAGDATQITFMPSGRAQAEVAGRQITWTLSRAGAGRVRVTVSTVTGRVVVDDAPET